MARKLNHYIWLAVLAALVWTSAAGQSYRSEIVRGNRLYAQEEYSHAESAYRNAMSEEMERFEGRFNLGNALYRQERYDEAIDVFTDAMQRTTNKHHQARAWHNIGNAYAVQEKWKEAVQAYRQALLRDPDNDKTRHNLALAMRNLKEQEEEEEEQQEENQQDQEGGDEEDKQNKQEQQGDEGDEQSEGQQGQDPGKDGEQKQQSGSQGEQEGEEREGQGRATTLTREQAEQLLEAIQRQEANTMLELRRMEMRGKQKKSEKDW